MFTLASPGVSLGLYEVLEELRSDEEKGALRKRRFKIMIVLPFTIPTVVPTQQKNNDVHAVCKPYSCSHAAEK